MRPSWPLLCVLAGLMLIAGGFVFDLLFAGIPYEDASPEQAARYARNSSLAALISLLGLGAILLGLLSGIIRLFSRRRPYAEAASAASTAALTGSSTAKQ